MSKEAVEMLRSMAGGARYHGDEEVAKRAERCAAAVEEKDKEIERLREKVKVAEHRARNLADEVGTLREVNTGLGIENQALRAEEE